MTAQIGGLPIVRVEATDENAHHSTYYLNLTNMSSARLEETPDGPVIQLLMLGMFPGSGQKVYGLRLTVRGEQAQKLQGVLDQFDLLKPPPSRQRRLPE